MSEKGLATKKMQIIAIIIAVVILISVSFYLFKPNASISAMKYRTQAELLANDWHNDSILKGVSTDYQYVNNDGTSEVWKYAYCSFTEYDGSVYKYEQLLVVYNHNGFEECIYSNISCSYLLTDNSNNWLIDSTEAYQIACDNQEISEFITDYSMTLKGINLLFDNNTGWNWFLYFRGEDQNQTIDLDVNVDPKTGDILHYQTFSTPTP